MVAIIEGVRSFLPGKRSSEVQAPPSLVAKPIQTRFEPYIDRDPRNPILRRSIEELASLISFKEFRSKEITRGLSLEFPLLSSDVGGVRPLRRLLSVHRFPDIWVSFTVGGSTNDNYPNVHNLVVHRSASLAVKIPGETPRTHASALVINAGRVAQAYRPDKYLDEGVKMKRFRKKDNIYDTGEDDLSGRRDASPEQIINGLNAVVKGLRIEFLAREVERANAILTPTQSALVEAICERGMAIHAGSNNRGFYDHFVLAGFVGSNNRLEKLGVVFSTASDSEESQWKGHNVLDGLELPSLDRSTRFSVASATNEDPNEDRISGYAVVGRIGLAQRGGRHIPIELHEVNREGMMHGQVSDIPSELFRRFLLERIGAFEFKNRAPILLTTSIPTVV